MAFTKIVGAGIHTLSNVHTHNVNSSGIITATSFVGPFNGSDGDFSGKCHNRWKFNSKWRYNNIKHNFKRS